MPDDEFVSIYSAKTSGEADVVRLALEAEGIAANVAGKQFADLFGMFEFQVLVKRTDEERAKTRLANRPATGVQNAVFDADNWAPEDENSPAAGADTPPILSWIGRFWRPRRNGPAWLRWFVG
jgi:hypothetical protein